MQKSLDQKIADIRANPSGSKAFIIADAKDADMAFGITAPGQKRPLNPERVLKSEIHWKTLEEYRRQIRDVVRQGLVDIMLMSASNVEQLAMRVRLFENSHVTPAARANDATDIWVIRGASYIKEPSRPFRSATLDHIKCGEIECDPGATTTGADLGLYSVTFNHNFERDFETLRAFKEFREEAERKNFRYFLEVFDPQLIVGILGGSAGTTYDAFKLIADAQKHGARVALFGRKINHAENPLAFIEFLRRLVEREITPEEAVKAYHGVLEKLGVAPHRALADDLQPSSGATSYGGSGGSRTTIVKPDGTPAAKPETSRVAEQLARIRQRFGE